MQRPALIALAILLAISALVLWDFFGDPGIDGSNQQAPSPPESSSSVDSRDSSLPDENLTSRIAELPSADSDAAAPSGALRVQVEWQDGSAAPDIEVRLRGAEQAVGFRERARQTSGEEGRLSFADVPPGKFSLRTPRGDRMRLDVTGEDQDVVFTLDDGVEVLGTVLDASDRPIANAGIWLQTRDPLWTGGTVVARSGADGRFRIERVRPVVSLGAIAPLFEPSKLVDLETVDTDREPVEVTLRLTSVGGDVVGRVTDASGNAVEGALVGIGDESGRLDYRGDRVIERWSIRTDRTDSDGRYELRGVKPGESPVTVFHEGFGFTRSTCEVLRGETVTHDVTVLPSGTLRGTVTQADGTPAAGAVIRCYDVEPRVPFLQGGQIDFDEAFGYLTASTDDEGHYELPNVSAGVVHVFAQPGGRQGFVESVLYDRIELDMPPGGELEWNATLSAGRSIQGVVRFRDGFPMEHVFLTLTDEKSSETRTVTNDGEGSFRFIRLDDSTYSVRVQYWDAPEGTPPLELGGLVPGPGKIELRAPFDKPVKLESGDVSGRIDDVGLRVTNWKDVRVVLMSDQRWFRDNGKVVESAFRFDGVEPCRFRLALMQGTAELATSEWFELKPGAQLDTGSLATVPGGSVRVRASRPEELNMTECSLWLKRDGAARSTKVEFGTTSEMLVENLTPGIYELTAYPEGGMPVKAAFEVVAFGVTDVEFRMTPGVVLDMKAWFESGSPPANYTHRVLDLQGAVVRSVDGKIGTRPTRPLTLITTVPRGEFRIEVIADGELSHTAEVDTRERSGRIEIELTAVR